MRLAGVFVVLSCAIPVSASAATIPPDLEARGAELQRQAPPQVLAWAHEQGVALARASGPVDLGALEQSIKSQFVKHAPAAKSSSSAAAANWAVRGDMNGNADIAAVAFIVMMEASKAAQEDLKAIMAKVKAINSSKAALRSDMNKGGAVAASMAPTPTPPPDRVALLVVAARSIQGRTHGADLATMKRR